MVLFLLAAGAVVYYLSPLSPQPTTLLIDAFSANPALNGLILLVLFLGIVYQFNLTDVVARAVGWIEGFREGADPTTRRMRRPPGILIALSQLLAETDFRERFTPELTKAMLDSVGTRIDEAREMGRYVMNLLVFLGLLGTFWGLLQTVNAVADTINGLATTGGAAEDAIAQLIANLREPLSGMGTAFSSSLFGLGGSLIVGFLDLQAGQAQNRFYTDLEDWLAGMTETTRASRAPGGAKLSDSASADLIEAVQNLEAALAANAETQIKAQAGLNAELKDEIRALNRTLIRVGGGE
jgi:biopolymer transport protein ExbB/TolQ